MKRLLALILALCIILSFSTIAHAQDIKQTSLEHILQNWIACQYDEDVEIDNIVPLYNYDHANVGHLITFQKAGSPAGYIVLSHLESEHPIIEYALDGENVYSYLKEQLSQSNKEISSKDQSESGRNKASIYSIAKENILYTDFINYSLLVKNDDEVLLFNQNKETRGFTENKNVESRSPLADTFYDGYYDLPPETVTYSQDNIPGAGSTSMLIMGNMPGVTSGEGNCGPTSLANTVKLYAENGLNSHAAIPGLRKNGSDTETYTRLKELSGYSCADPATMSELLNGLRSYSTEMGYSCSINNYLTDAWSDFTRDILNDKPILLYTSSSAGTAHAQVVVGYRLYTNNAKYLRVFTGWSGNATFVKFKPSSLNNFNGYCVSISS